MAEQFRPPKSALAEQDLPASMTAREVLALRSAGGATGEWAEQIASQLEARAAILEETDMTTPDTRAIGPDVPLSDALAALLGEEFELYCRAQEAHWNVTGPDFAEYHALFESVYADAYGAVDPIAENLRKIGSLTPSLAVMPCEYRYTDAIALAKELLEESEQLAAMCRSVFDIATAAGQQGIANFLAERQDAHAKWAWQLRSSLGVAEIGESPAIDAIMVDQMVEEVTEEEPAEFEMKSADPEVEARRSLIESAEKRTYLTEMRAVRSGEEIRMVGYAAMWDQEADGLPFREVIKRGAFSRSLDRGDDVFLLVNHDTDQLPLARRDAGTLTVIEDEIGLRMEADLDPMNPRAAELASALERGDVDKMSFAFRVGENGSAKNDEGVRELRNLDLFEVSVVTWPAYSATTVGLREAAPADDLALRARLLRAKLAHQDIK